MSRMTRLLPLFALLACTDKGGDDSALDGDGDGDGHAADVDCDDADPGVHPGAEEVCDGLDQDCDGEVDEDAADARTLNVDADGDGYGDPNATGRACAPGEGLVDDATDCDDGDATTHPGAQEQCSGKDDDCDGLIDDLDDSVSPDSQVEVWPDGDGDGYGADGAGTLACAPPSGHVTEGGDCDDAEPAVNPGAAEVCNGLDDDCDGEVDVGAVDGQASWVDADGDGYGDDATEAVLCELPSGRVAAGGDCDDADGFVYPGAPALCDGQANDCDSASSWTGDAGRVTHFPDSGGAVDLTADFTASTGAPTAVSITSSGVLRVCEGSYRVALSVDATRFDLVGEGSGVTTLSGGGAATVLTLRSSYAAYTVEGVTITEGYGCYGSGICSGRVGSCSSSGASFSFARETSLSLYDVVVTGNDGPIAQGGVYASYYGSFAMDASEIVDNAGTGLYLYNASATCAGATTTADGVWGNDTNVYMLDVDSSVDFTFEATACDFDGSSPTAYDLVIYDTTNGYNTFDLGDDETISCSSATVSCQ